MKASFVELRKKSNEIVRALNRNESVTVFYRGRAKAVMQPIAAERGGAVKTAQHAAFGLWRDRADWGDVPARLCALRKRRFDDL